MTAQIKAPEPQRRQAEGETGATNHRVIVPAWGRKRVAETLLRFQGQYTSPEALNARAAAEARESRDVRAAHADALSKSIHGQQWLGAAGSPTSEKPGTHPADASRLSAKIPFNPKNFEFDHTTGEILPCRSLETTQPNTLAGPHKRPLRPCHGTSAICVRHTATTA